MDINNLTPEMVAAIKENGGFSGTLKGGLDIDKQEVFIPRNSVPIRGYGTNLRPQVKNLDGEVVSDGMVTRANVSTHLSNHQAEKDRIEAEQQEQLQLQHELAAYLEPKKLMAQIQYLDRQVKKLTKEVNTLKKLSTP